MSVKNNRTEYVGILPHKNVLECPVFALALHLYFRFHVMKEKFPDLLSPLVEAKWHGTLLVYSNDPKKGM